MAANIPASANGDKYRAVFTNGIGTTDSNAATLTVARMSGVTSATVAREWNGAFLPVGALFLALWMVLLALVL